MENKEFKLLEYERLHQLSMHEYKESESRVRFFTLLVTGTLSVLTYLHQSIVLSSSLQYTISLACIGVLLLLGFKILDRMIMRNIQIIALNDLRKEIQLMFAEKDPELEKYFAFKARRLSKKQDKRIFPVRILLRNSRNGSTLISLMVFINRILIAGLILISLLEIGWPLYLCFIASGLLFFGLSIVFAAYVEAMLQNEPWAYV